MCYLCQHVSQQGYYNASSEPLTPQLFVVDGSLSPGLRALAHWSWHPNSPGVGISLTHSFTDPPQISLPAVAPTMNSPGRPAVTVTGIAFTAAQRANGELALQTFVNVADIRFTEVSGGADISIGTASLAAAFGSGTGGVAFLPSQSAQISDVPIFMDTSLGNMNPGEFGFMAMIHEYGHSMGMKHPFDASPTISGAEGTVDYTVMSYSWGEYVSRSMPRTLMYNDVQVMQFLYGKNTSYNAGDTVYQLNQMTGAYTIWDAGGTDTFSAAGSNVGVRLDLRDGGGKANVNTIGDRTEADTASGISFHKTVVWVAKGAVIENAVGGNANDEIFGTDTGNELYGSSGADTIYGGGGGDVLFGGTGFTDTSDGADQLYGGNGSDLIISNAGNDTIFGDGGPGGSATTPGNDTLYGGAGNDFINGERGFDLIVAGPGQDSLYGGADVDAFVFGNDNSGGVNIIYDFQGAGAPGGDFIRILANANGSGFQSAADVLAAIVTDANHSYIPVAGTNGGYGILVGWTKGLTADDILVVQGSQLLAAL